MQDNGPGVAAHRREDPGPRAGDDELRVGHLLANLGRRTLHGGAVMFAAQGIKVLVQLGAVVLLARLLPPSAFGLVAMVVAISATVDLARDLGLSAVTIQKAQITHEQVSALFWINAALGALFALGLAAAAPVLAAFYDEPALTTLARWLSVAFLLSGLATQHCALLRRQMRFTAVAVMEAGGEVVALGIAVALALAGAGLWALVAQRLAAPAISLVLSWHLCRWRPGRPAWAAGTAELVRFGLSVAGTNVVATLARTIDQVLVGWLWGAATLGLYERAARLLMVPLNNINLPLYTVAMPALSRLGDRHDAYRRAFIAMLEKVALVTLPAGILVALTADWLVAVLFGAQWAQAAPLVAFFGMAAAYQPAMIVLGLLYLPLNRPHELFRATIVDGALIIVSVVAGLSFGATGVAASVAALGLLVRLPTAVWLATRAGPVRQSDIYGAFVMPVVAGMAVAGTVIAMRHFLRENGQLATAWIGLACVVPAAFIAAGLAAWIGPRRRLRAAGP